MEHIKVDEDEPTFVARTQRSDPWAKIVIIAERVGVQPTEGPRPDSITARLADGRCYDIFEVLIATLDWIEKRV